MQPSPYTPGQTAREVPGRTQQLSEIDERLMFLTQLQRLVPRVRVDTGPRGLGKTSLLREAQRHAERTYGLSTVWVTAGDRPLVTAIAEDLTRQSATWGTRSRERVRRAVDQVKVAGGVPGVVSVQATLSTDRTQAPAGTRQFETLLRAAAESTHGTGRQGLVLFVDEIQAADSDGLRTLAYTWQHLQSEGEDVPLAVFAAGLPDAPEVLAQAATFSERFAYRPLHRLEDDAARVALVGPAQRLGVQWDSDALEMAVAASDGYPHTVQLYGDAAWSAAGYPDQGAVINRNHLLAAGRAVDSDLESLFRARWAKATEAEQRLLAAMVIAGATDGPVRRRDVAGVLGTDTTALSVARSSLMDKGIIEAPEYGLMGFTIPKFAAYVEKQAGLIDPGRGTAPGSSPTGIDTAPRSAELGPGPGSGVAPGPDQTPDPEG